MSLIPHLNQCPKWCVDTYRVRCPGLQVRERQVSDPSRRPAFPQVSLTLTDTSPLPESLDDTESQASRLKVKS